jgi:hypothetical protein
MTTREKPALTRRQLIKAGGAAAGAAAVVAAVPTSMDHLFSPALAAESSPTGSLLWVDGFARPSGAPPAGPSLQQKRFTAVARVGGEGFGVDSDDAYHGPSDNVSDHSATEYTITSAEMSGSTLTLQGNVVRAVDSASVGKPVAITATLGPPSGARTAGVPSSMVVALTYTLGSTQFTGGGVVLM